MPIYEFYCPDCHTLFSFLARRPTDKRPACPRCRRPRIDRRASRFAISTGRPEPAADAGADPLDDPRMESAFAAMAAEAEHIDESNPRQMAGFMRSFFQRTGMPLGAGVEEAIRRMEAGEDPDRIEEELGDALEGEAPEGAVANQAPSLGRLRRALRPPQVDETLHEL